jgi:galactokinase/mevalonate kinase-like predicted kinase
MAVLSMTPDIEIQQWCTMATREMDRLAQNQDRIEQQTREDIKALSEDIKTLSEKQSRDTERIFERLDSIIQKQTDIKADMEQRFTNADHAQDLNIKELMIQARESGKKAGIQAGAGAGGALATIIWVIVEILNKLR